MEVSKEAKEFMAREGYDAVYGARPLKRYIENTLETNIARKIISGEIHDGLALVVDYENGDLVIRL